MIPARYSFWSVNSAKFRNISTDSLIISSSAWLSNCSRNAPVLAGVVRVARAGRFSRIKGSRPAHAAKKAEAAPTMPPPMITNPAWSGRS
ncbi:MAG: hypothetical protein V3W06_08725, partial [Acidimicrobiia bacterium]